MTTLVLGGTGMTGKRVVERLARDLEVRMGEPASWTRDVESVFVPVSAGPDVAAVAVEHGVRRLVLLSRRGDGAALPVERAVREAGVEWTIVRAGLIAQYFSEGPLLQPLLTGELTLPIGPVGEPFVDAGDVADVAVAALTEDGHGGRVYELTGPRLLTFAEAVEEIGAAAGRTIRYARVAPGARASLPDDQVAWLAGILDGRNARLTNGVRRALGREPRDFADFVREAVATGVWHAPATSMRRSHERDPIG